MVQNGLVMSVLERQADVTHAAPNGAGGAVAPAEAPPSIATNEPAAIDPSAAAEEVALALGAPQATVEPAPVLTFDLRGKLRRFERWTGIFGMVFLIAGLAVW